MVSVQKSPLEMRLLEFCERTLKPHGFRVLDLDCAVSGRSLLRIFIEPIEDIAGAEGQSGVSLDDCVRVTGILGPALDVEDLIPGSYELEVSSPGLERRLRLQSDFEKCLGSEVKLKLTTPVPGVGKKVRAELLSVNEKAVQLNHQGKEVVIPWSRIRRGNLVWNFGEESRG